MKCLDHWWSDEVIIELKGKKGGNATVSTHAIIAAIGEEENGGCYLMHTAKDLLYIITCDTRCRLLWNLVTASAKRN